ncbi:MAG TPA: hypothetical protein VMX58_07880 [Patescibacteria group bacterium]|nr:hypothetical protein [Patescibacteria group bacterium]
MNLYRLLFIAACIPLSSCHEQELQVVYEGRFPEEIGYADLRIANFGHDYDCVIAVDFFSTNISIFYFQNNEWKLFERIPHGLPDIEGVNRKIAVGDVIGSGEDEILIYGDKEVVIKQWTGKDFSSVEYSFPYYIYEAVIGDIDDDSMNEMVALVSDSSFSLYDSLYAVRPCVTSLASGEIKIEWLSGDEYTHRFTTRVPLRMGSIADFARTESNQLLLHQWSLDLMPTEYELWEWDDLNDTLRKVDASFPPVVAGVQREERRNFFVSNITAAFLGNTECLVAMFVYDRHEGGVPVVLKIDTNGSWTVTKQFDKTDKLYAVNIDGKGDGLLVQGTGKYYQYTRYRFLRFP